MTGIMEIPKKIMDGLGKFWRKIRRPEMVLYPDNFDYAKTKWTYVLSQTMKARIAGKKLLIDIDIRPDTDPGKGEYRRAERWSGMPRQSICASGYSKAVGFHDGLIWADIPQWVKISGGHEFNVAVKDETGKWLYPQDTAVTLRDYLDSTATADFMKGLHGLRLPEIDKHTIIMAAILGVGVIFGLFTLGVI